MPAAGTAESARGKPVLRGVWYGIGGLLLLLVAVLSLVPVADTSVNDKLSHLVTYFVLGGWFALLAGNRTALTWTFAALVVYGGTIELLQSMTAYRQAEAADLLANAIGAGLGMGLYLTPLRRLLLFVDRRLAGIFFR
jgi:VanZ family protein